MATLEAALAVAERGWFLYPLDPATKIPAIKNPWEQATTDPEQIQRWWKKFPNANIGFAPGRSGHVVVDIDHGLRDETGLRKFMRERGLPDTFAVRTGRRVEADGSSAFRVQLYFTGEVDKSFNGWRDAEYSGDLRGPTGHVAGVGSVHPDSGALYEILWDKPCAPAPPWVKSLRRYVEIGKEALDHSSIIDNWRNENLFRELMDLRRRGANDWMIETFAHGINEDAERMPNPLGEEELAYLIANVCKKPIGGPEIQVVIGKKKPQKNDWRELFHTREETEGTPDPEFLIQDFLQVESVTGLIGPARARKSIVTLNIIHSLLTGAPLFGHFEVPNKPDRVVYLCPESGLKSLGRRIRNMGLGQYIGKSLFFTSMNSDPVKLSDPMLREAVRDSVLFVDTAIRHFNGDENSSADMKLFGEECHGLIRDGVRAIVLLHHTAKNAESLTLESGRGSGDFGGFLTCCWGTKLDDNEDPYLSHSLMTCVKQRDFQADSFKVSPSGSQENFFLQYVEGSANARVQVGAKAKAGKAKAMAFIRANTDMTGEQIFAALAEQNIPYSITSCRNMLREARALAKVVAA